MIPDGPAFVTLHRGAATTAAALLGSVDGRWRLLGAMSAPAAIDPEVLMATLGARLRLADRALADALRAEAVSEWPRAVVAGGAAPTLAVLAATDRTLERLEWASRRAGWAVIGRSAHRADPLEMTRLLLGRDVRAVLVGAADPPAADERKVVGELAELVAAAARRRPELTVVLSGAFGDMLDRFADAHQALEPVASAPPRVEPAADVAILRPDSVSTAVLAGERPLTSPPIPARAAPATSWPEAGAEGPDDVGQSSAERADAAAEPRGLELAGATSSALPSGATGPAVGTGPDPERTRGAGARPPTEGRAVARARPGSLIVAPAPGYGPGSDEPLRRLLDDLRAGPDDVWRGIARSAETLASLLERRIEVIALGQSAGLRAVAAPRGATGAADVAWAVVPEAALVPDGDESLVDRVLKWSTTTIDRYRMRDRLAELRLAPWGETHGDGAPLRMAAARAALERLVSLTPELGRPVPDLMVATGGVWASAPGPAIALTLADVVRRPGASQLALDHARLLAALGTIEDPDPRARILGDLADDLLVPLGSLVLPAGLHAGRSAGRLVVHASTGTTELDLVPGGLELVDLPPGESAVADLRFADTVVLGTRGRRFSLDVGGGLGGLLVDLRDVPLRLPDRPDRRRELLGAWQRALWVGLEA